MKDFDVGISYQVGLPHEVIEKCAIPLKQGGLTVELHKREDRVFASLEWTIPTLVIAYLAKPYFNAFLSEAGKDHYKWLKSGLMPLFSHLFGTNPEDRDQCRSLLFSIQSKDHTGQALKCVFPEGATTQQYSDMLDQLHEILVDDVINEETSKLSEILSDLEIPTGSRYIEYSLDCEEWVAIDTQKEILKQSVKAK